jgi:hypothetical protein
VTTATANRPGVRYRATRNSDGTFNVHGVPIMGTLKAGERGNAKAVDRAWLEAALTAAQADAARGYLAPIKPTHADGVPYTCGFMLPTHVAEEAYDDGQMPTLYADFIAVDEATHARLQRGEWPSRSVEVVDWKSPRVNALALLAADAPHFRFPLMAGTLLDDAMPGRFCAAKLAAFGDETDPRETAAHEAAEASKLDAILRFLVQLGRKLGVGGEAEADAEKDAVAQPVNDRPADEEGSDAKDGDASAKEAEYQTEDPETEGGKPSAEAAAENDDDEPEDEEMPANNETENLAAKAGAKLAAMTAERDGLSAKLAAAEKTVGELTAKLSAAESKLTEIESAAKREKDISEAETKLKAKKIVLPTNFRDLAAKMHAGSPEAFAAFVSTFEVNPLSTDPDRHFGGGSPVADKAVSDAVAKFAAGKPLGTYEKATVAAEKWIEHRRSLPSSPVTIEDWLHTHAGAAAR